MRLLFVFHYCSPRINDIAWGPIYLGSQGHQILVLSSRHVKLLKGEHFAPEHEIIGSTEFFRPYAESMDLRRRPFSIWDRVRRKVEEFGPDAVIGFGEFACKLPARISEDFQIPLFLYMENLRSGKIGLPIRGRTILARYMPWLLNALSRRFLGTLAKKAHGIMFAYYGDRHLIPDVEALGTRVFYVPWCSEVGSATNEIERNKKTGIYIGSLEPFKNSAELITALPLILEETITEQFTVIGPGSLANEVQRLARHYGNRLEYIPSLPRADALNRLRASGYGFTPVRDCGLGFIGDCWGTGTPLVTTHDLDGFLDPHADAIVAPNPNQVPRVINELLSSSALYQKYKHGGLIRHQANYTGAAVGTQYIKVINECLGAPGEQIGNEV